MTNRNDPINSVVQTSINPYGGERMECTDEGLTKREYFAAMALQGILANSEEGNNSWNYDIIGKHCVLAADALIEQLNK